MPRLVEQLLAQARALQMALKDFVKQFPALAGTFESETDPYIHVHELLDLLIRWLEKLPKEV